MGRVFNIIAGLKLNTAQFKAGTKEASNALGNLNKATGTTNLGFKGLVGSIGFFINTMELVDSAVRNTIGTIMEFSKAASELKAVTGSNAEQMDTLTNSAISLSQASTYTATEIVKLQTVLARLGFDPKEIMNMTKAVLDLSMAMGSGAEQTAELLGSTLTVFGKDASYASEMADILQAAANQTALSFEKLSVAMPYASTAARQYGLDVEQTAAILGILADNGLKASTIGTSTRKIFTDLSVKGLDFNKVMKEIRESADPLAMSFEYFGRTAANAGIILAMTGKSLEDLKDSFENVEGSAKRAAAVMVDNLSGDIDKAKNAWNAFVLAIDKGDGVISRALRKITQDFAAMMRALSGENIFQSEAIANLANPKAKAAIMQRKKTGLSDSEARQEQIRLLNENQKIYAKIKEVGLKDQSVSKDDKLFGKQRALTVSLYEQAEANRILVDSYNKVNVAKEKTIDLSGEEAYVDKDKKTKYKYEGDAVEKMRHWQEEYEKSLKDEAKAKKEVEEETLKTISAQKELNDELDKASLSGEAMQRLELKQWYDDTATAIFAMNIELKDMEVLFGKLKSAFNTKSSGITDAFSKKGAKEDDKSFKKKVDQIQELSNAYEILFRNMSDEGNSALEWWANYASSVVSNISAIVIAIKEWQSAVAAMETAKDAAVSAELARNAATTTSNAGTAASEAAADVSSIPFGWIAIPAIIAAVLGMVMPLVGKSKKGFALGGIVPGTSFSGDNVVANVNSGEMILNRGQQQQLFDIANGKGTGAGAGEVEFVIKGDKLVGVLGNHNRKMSKIR